MVAWAFSLAAAGNFPALVLGIWWKRCTSTGAVFGIIAGFGATLTYLVVSRYYPVFGVNVLGMYAIVDAVKGTPVVDVAAALANPATANAVLANKVGWLDIHNISAAMFGMPIGFIVMMVVSRITPEPSAEMQALVDEIRKPRGRTVLEEKT